MAVDLRRLWILGLIAAVLVGFVGCLVAGRASAAGDANEAGCPSATMSSPGFRPWLPDCRAYEIVTQANSGDLSTVIGSYGFPDGAHVFYKDFLPLPGSGAHDGLIEPFIATRTSSGWIQQAISSPQGEGPKTVTLGVQSGVEAVSLTNDFSQAFVSSPYQNPFESPRLDQATGVGVYKLSLADGTVETVSLPDSGVLTQAMIETPECLEFGFSNGCGMVLAGSSADGSEAFFVATAKLATAPGTPEDPHAAGNEVYERTGGHTYLVSVLPNESVPVCAEIGQGVSDTIKPQSAYSYGAVAPNGANVVFNDCNNSVYLRNLINGTTVQLQGSTFGGRAGTGKGEEEKIFTLGGGKIYEYQISTDQTTEVGEGGLLAYSSDGSRVYSVGNEEEIYAYYKGVTNPIANNAGAGGYSAGPFGLNAGGQIVNGSATSYGKTANMPVASGNSDGSHLLFIDTAKLTGYENEKHQEAYVYDVEDKKITCISCDPLIPEPESETEPLPEPNPELKLSGSAQLITGFMLDSGEQQYQSPSPPFISENGSRAVFETTEALVAQDTNGTTDVYEWEREGSEGCSTESLRVKNLTESAAYSAIDEGCLYLLSSGLGKETPFFGLTDGTHLVGASENLKDIYIDTGESLLPNLDNASKVYDVRVDGGFPYTPPSHGCEQTECEMPTGEPPALGQLTTESVEGSGNAKNGTAARHGKRQGASMRRRRLARALNACRKHKRGRKRVVCEHVARRTYGARAGWDAIRGDEGRGRGERK